MEVKSKCCNAKIEYVKDWGNKHDECTKCGKDLSLQEMMDKDKFYKDRQVKIDAYKQRIIEENKQIKKYNPTYNQ